MTSITNINNNSSVVNVGRTTPVSPGIQPSSRSIPVVVASDQAAIPVEEQNKIQSEVALSLLGIPRAEVALGIFADVNTYDVNPTEWSSSPATWTSGYGTRHIPAEAGALVEAPRDRVAILTSKRFFRYQPGRVSAATFGIKSTVSSKDFAKNPIVRKYGIYDNFDGYYWETRQSGKGDNFAVIRRTQSLLKTPNSTFGQTGQALRKPTTSTASGEVVTTQIDDYRTVGTPPVAGAGAFSSSTYIKQRNRIVENRLDVALEALSTNLSAKCQRDVKYIMDAVGYDITLGTNYNATFQGLAEANSAGYPLATEVATAITNTENAIVALSGVDNTADTAVNSFFTRLRSIAIDSATRVEAVSDANQTRRIAALNGVTFAVPTGLTGSRVTANSTIVTERSNLATDVNTFVSTTYPGATHNVNKCTRDVLFTLNAVAYDILYGGNSASWQAARFFMYNGFSQSDKTADYIAQTVAAYGQLKTLLDADLATAGVAQPERTKAGELIDFIIGVIQNVNIDHLPPKVYPDTSWANASLTAAQTATTQNKQAIASSVSPITNLTANDNKCLRDVDFWIDMYLQDFEAGGDAHTALNTRNYSSAILDDKEQEIETHFNVKTKLLELFTGEGVDTVFYDKLQTLTEIPIAFFRQAAPQTNPVAPTSYGSKARLDTLFDARKYFWAYTVTESGTYVYGAGGDGTDGATVTDPAAIVYTKNGISYTLAEVKDKCIRDVVYVIDGYKDDISGGGNFATAYNASMYYQGSGLSIDSQAVSEKTRHQSLQTLISTDLTNDAYSTSVTSKFTELSSLIINNFDIESTNIAEIGNRGVAGNLVTLRDGLIMVHAAVYDPGLLKEQKRIKAALNAETNTITISEGHVTFGQRVRYFGADNGGLINGKLYQVRSAVGPKASQFTLVNPADPATILSIATDDRNVRIQIVNPFIFPDVYDPEVYREDVAFQDLVGTSTPEDGDDPFIGKEIGYQGYDYRGMMFPYMYTSDGLLPKNADAYAIGYIDTANTLQTPAEINDLKNQIDSVNFSPEYINFIRDNVKPEYWGVYEYRVPRSRFSTDKLNGKENNVVYSDVAIGPGGKVLPGQSVLGNDGLNAKDTSLYDYDFGKVTMLKIEFSWYGAVGALFLAYVPVSNGEARWVRVHHLRASNQLKISSLGNATLPITYGVFGGGSSDTLGDGEEITPTDYGYGRNSHNLVKYGASYYIDGGDRGTVRLYSHTNPGLIPAYGTNHSLGAPAVTAPNDGIDLPYITLSAGIDPLFYMSARLKTNNRIDQNIRVEWVDGQKLYLSSTPSGTSDFVLLPDRANTVYGIETKENIISSLGQSVRNRVQVYPTKLSTVNVDTGDGAKPCRMRMKKTPLFQTDAEVNGTFSLTESYEITGENLPLPTTAADYLDEGESVYGWFRVFVGEERTTAFGRLYREAAEYYFELVESFNGTVTIEPTINFLKDGRFNASGVALTTVTKTTEEKEGLSSVVIADDSQVPIPRTGVDVATIYLQQGGTEQIELNTYYDYNKEYLSFPLTDIAESLYFSVDIDSPNTESVGVGIGVTWEEQ